MYKRDSIRTRKIMLLIVLICIGGMVNTVVFSQVSDKAALPTTKGTVGADVREAKPEVYYLRNSKGDLVLVPNFSLEDYEKFLKLTLGQGNVLAPESSFLGVIQIDGEQREQAVDLTVKMQIRINSRRNEVGIAPAPAPASEEPVEKKNTDERTVRVPLRFGQAALVDVPEYDGSGGCDIRYEAETGGYALWLSGLPLSDHKVTLKYSVPVQRVGIENRIVVSVPTSPAQVNLRVTNDRAVAQAISANTILKRTERQDGRGTTFTFVGASGDFQLSWRDAGEQTVRARPVLDASSNVVVSIDARNRIRADARLRITSHSQASQEFRLQLPIGFRLTESQPNSADYQISPLGEMFASGNSNRQTVMIRLAREATNSPEIRLHAEWQGISGELSSVDVAGFDVEGAVRQAGVIELAFPSNLSVRWSEGPSVHRVDTLPEASRQNQVTARFEYDSQPASLRLTIAPNVMRVTVEPIHVIDIQPNRVELRSLFRYSVAGGRLERVDFQRNGWKIVRVQPSTVLSVDPTQLVDDQVGFPLSVDIKGGQDVELYSVRDLDANAATTLFDLFPIPINPQSSKSHLVVAPASFVVTVADNVEAEVLAEQLRGLVSDPIPPKINLPVRQQAMQFFRQQPGADPFRFTFRWKNKDRETQIDTEHIVTVSESQTSVATRFRISVAHAPMGRVTVLGPRSLLEDNAFRAIVEGRNAPIELVDDEDDVSLKTGWIRGVIELPEKRLGSFELSLEHPSQKWTMPARQSAQVPIPLVIPLVDAQTTIRSTQLQLTPNYRLRTSVIDDQWRSLEKDSGPSTDGRTLVYQTQGNPDSVTLEVHTGTLNRTGTVVHRAWIQSWLSDRDRRDRAVFYLTTNERRLRIHIPANVRDTDLEVFVDHVQVRNHILASSEIQVEFAPLDHRAAHVVEVVFWLGRPARQWGQQSLETIRLLGADRIDRLHWEVAVPPKEHLVSEIAGFVAEYTWKWRNGIWQRVPHFSQRDLEYWSGGTPSKPIPEIMNRYVFSGLIAPASVVFTTYSRSTLVAVSAGSLFLVGIVGLVLRWWARPVLAISLGLLLIPFSILEPDLGILLGQSAALGVVLLCVAQMWRYRVEGVLRQGRTPSYSAPSVDSRALEFHPTNSMSGSSVHRSTKQLVNPSPSVPSQAVP